MNEKSHSSGAFTIAEMLIALAILALLLAAVALAFHGSLMSYSENQKIAEVIQASRVVLHRIMTEVRTAEAIDVDSQRISIIPAANTQGLTQIEYVLDGDVLYCRRTVNGAEVVEPFIASDGAVRIDEFTVSRETAVDGEGLTYTRSITASLGLRSGENTFQVTASACPRRNLTY